MGGYLNEQVVNDLTRFRCPSLDGPGDDGIRVDVDTRIKTLDYRHKHIHVDSDKCKK